ncbi:MAG TPA: LacI family DNA-binding transcriptional regulator [Bosea sp. (in: a-proteobacteria)]|jgi:LacI family gluconate utilization system Gnt-I transcriptional repressor|uniref:LacI family DNA-binding transcriptional regulator n=1 Tax=Bosea sp. (in: a-proteobacteria) TaxID=1871050 RepID=UPI002E139FC0|nr:LacI family DNA-binding transcriptional regulator [Bosea sp. (in: a-proteobacteria)]
MNHDPAKRLSGWATMSDVAHAAGVSLMTVSRVYKNPSAVSVGTRERVLSEGERLGFVPNMLAGNLASGRSAMIGIVVPSLRNSNNANSIQGMADRLRQSSYQFMITNTGYSLESEAAAVAAFIRRRPDGLVLTGTRHGEETRALLHGSGLPVVEVWETEGPIIDMATGFRNHDAGAEIARYLIAKGYDRIGYLDYPVPGLRRYDARREGALQALRDAGLRADLVVSPQREDATEDASSFRGGASGLTQLLEAGGARAVLCASDLLAVGVMFEAQRRGMRVPDDLAVAGFGDFEIAAEIPPGLTTIRTQGYQMGWAAADMLVSRIEGNPIDTPVRNVDYSLVQRGSA